MSTGLDLKTPDEDGDQERFRCPVSACTGVVAYIDGRADGAWACGECGAYWKIKNSLFRDIGRVCQEYPYRAKFYQANASGYSSSGVFPDAQDESRVAEESADIHPSFDRT